MKKESARWLENNNYIIPAYFDNRTILQRVNNKQKIFVEKIQQIFTADIARR